MKKPICILLCLSLLFGFSLTLSAQSSGEKLDQAELLKHFIGTWEAEIGQDTVIVVKCTSSNNGLYCLQENKANGNVFLTFHALMGLSNDKEMIIGSFLNPNGTVVIDIGKFVSKSKFVTERHSGNRIHSHTTVEWDFSIPESFTGRIKWRGEDMIWPDKWMEWTFKKIK